MTYSYYALPGIKRNKVESIIEEVCAAFTVKEHQLKWKDRHRKYSFPRHVCFYLISEHTNLTLKKIGELFGGCHHTTIIHGRMSVAKILEVDKDLQIVINDIKVKCGLRIAA